MNTTVKQAAISMTGVRVLYDVASEIKRLASVVEDPKEREALASREGADMSVWGTTLATLDIEFKSACAEYKTARAAYCLAVDAAGRGALETGSGRGFT